MARTPTDSTQSSDGPAVAGPPDVLVSAIERAVRPLIRLMIRHGLTLPQLLGRLKRLYVEEAESHFALEGKSLTDSRISLLTGVHRKDVRQLRRPDPDMTPRPRASLGAEVLGRWLGAALYRDSAGEPLALPRQADDGPSFESLVAGVSKDIRPRALLDEWLASGTVVELTDGRIALEARALVPSARFEDLAWFLGRNLGDHAAAAAHNVLGAGSPMFERAVFYDRLSEGSVAALKTEAARDGMRFLTRLNEAANGLADADEGDPEATRRITVGLYVFDEDEAESGSDQDEAAT